MIAFNIVFYFVCWLLFNVEKYQNYDDDDEPMKYPTDNNFADFYK